MIGGSVSRKGRTGKEVFQRSRAFAPLDTFLPPRNSEFKVGFYYVNLIDIIFMIFYNIFITNVRIKEKIL